MLPALESERKQHLKARNWCLPSVDSKFSTAPSIFENIFRTQPSLEILLLSKGEHSAHQKKSAKEEKEVRAASINSIRGKYL